MADPSAMGSFGKYAIVSGISFVANFAITITLHEIVGLSEEFSYGAALITIFVMNFSLMRFWVYSHTRNESNGSRQFVLTLATSLSFRAIEYLSFLLLHTLLGMYYIFAMLIIMVTSNFTKFFIYHYLVFTRTNTR